MTLKVLIPEATRNYCTNPSIGLATTGWALVTGATITRVLTYARFGRAALHVVCPGAVPLEGCKYDHAHVSTDHSPITASVYVRGRGQVVLRLNCADIGRVWDSAPVRLNAHYWRRIAVTGQIGAVTENQVIVSVLTHYNHKADFYVDGLQVELKGYATTYCDGDQELELLPHDGNAYFEWVGQRHATESFRSKAFRMGGRFENLVQGLDANIYPIEASGLGMPPLALGTQIYSGNERANVQSIKALPRALSLTFHARRLPNSRECDPKSLKALNTARKALEDVLKPDLVQKPQSMLLRYEDGPCPMDLEAVYESGMEWEGDLRDPYANAFGVRLLGPNPYWEADSQDTSQLATSKTVTGFHAFLVARLAGEWQGFGSATFPIRVIKVHPNGDVYAGGDFTTIGGVAARRIARWDGTAWNILGGVGGDPDDGAVYAIAFTPDGDVYIGGTFTAIGGNTVNRVARYQPDTDTFHELVNGATPGVNSDVNAIVVDSAGNAYLGGAFTATVSGTAAFRIVKYNGPTTDTWTAIGAHSGLNLDVEALEVDLDGTTIYAGGQFTDEETHAGGTALKRVCKYTAAGGFQCLTALLGGIGMNGTVRALRMGLDGKLYIAGDFTIAGFWTAYKVALWNRVEFYPLGGDGDGLTGGNRVNTIDIDAKGNVYFGGDFTAATNDSLGAYLVMWNGTRFGHMDLVIGAEVLAVASKFDKLFVGYNGASISSIADVQTVTNEGAASAYPMLDVLGPLTVRWLENQDTGKLIRMNLVVQAGERVLLDLRPGYLKAVSEWRGNVISSIMPYSDFGDFALLPGDNRIAFLGTGGSGAEEVSLRWRNTNWSFDDIR
jgi:hypothetical protein